MSPQEWDDSPWYVTAAYMDGLIKSGVLKDPDEPNQPVNTRPGESPPGPTQNNLVDYASGAPLPRGFQTRRAG